MRIIRKKHLFLKFFCIASFCEACEKIILPLFSSEPPPPARAAAVTPSAQPLHASPATLARGGDSEGVHPLLLPPLRSTANHPPPLVPCDRRRGRATAPSPLLATTRARSHPLSFVTCDRRRAVPPSFSYNRQRGLRAGLRATTRAVGEGRGQVCEQRRRELWLAGPCARAASDCSRRREEVGGAKS